ncbi:MAG: CcdB family protein [Deferrisomatales bacterium]
MAQFDVHRNPRPASREEVPYLIDLQNDLLDSLATRVVAPLVRYEHMPTPARYLNPVFDVRGERVVLSTAELAGVGRHELGEVVGSLADHRDEIIRAIDFLLSGI